MKRKKVAMTAWLAVGFCVLLLAVNILLGLAMMNQSKSAMITLIDERMLDVANTAAAMLDGDSLRSLTAENEDSPAYRKTEEALAFLQKHIDLSYIYAVREEEDGSFGFIVDPDPVDPGQFGEKIVYTEALAAAGRGTASVDSTAFSDRWGRFYSAYSPVFDSDGRVAGVVGVDFDAEWYDAQIAKLSASILISSSVSLLVGAAIVLVFADRMRKKLRLLYDELSALSADVESLTREGIGAGSASVAAPEEGERTAREASGDTTEELVNKIRAMHTDMRDYIDFVRAQAYTDQMTGVGSKTAYLELTRALDEKIRDESASFCVAAFDVNGLKTTNDNYGHEEGDRLLIGAAAVIGRTFGMEHVFRTGGDEFIAVLEQTTAEEVAAQFETLDRELAAYNEKERPDREPLSFSKGAAAYRPGEDAAYREVFKRADEDLYRDKAKHYGRT